MSAPQRAQRVADIEIAQPDWQLFLAQAHFSQTQTSQLKSCLRFLLSQDEGIVSLLADTRSLGDSHSILSYLEQRRIDRSRNL